MKWIFGVVIFFNLSAQAEVNSEHVTSMIDQMVEKGLISREEANKAKTHLLNLSPEQWNKINTQAASLVSRSPASNNPISQNKIEEVQGIDLDSAQFKQIQNDLSKIIPQSKD